MVFHTKLEYQARQFFRQQTIKAILFSSQPTHGKIRIVCVFVAEIGIITGRRSGEKEERVKVHAFSDMVQRSSSLLRREVFCVYIQYQCTSSYTRKGAGSENGLPSFTDLFF